MKKIVLVPTDFSKNAWNALVYACQLYKNEDCDFHLLNAFTVKTYDIESIFTAKPGEEEYDLAHKNSKKGLAKILKFLQITNQNPLHKFQIVSLFGSPLEAIKKVVETKDIELVVMGTKGVTNASTVIYGSNTIDVMEKVRNCPILAIPMDVSFKEPNEIVFPTSFKTHFKRRELKYLYEISKITNAPVRILHINKNKRLSEDQINNKELLEDCLDGLDYTFHYMDNIDVNVGLHNFVQNRNSDMIVFINRKHTLLDSVFMQPMVKDLGANSQIPVLVLHDLRN